MEQENKNQIQACPSCSLRVLEFEGIGQPEYNKEQDRTFATFKNVSCPMCNWAWRCENV